MDSNVVECDPEREVCRGGPTLDILKEVQRAYENRMAHIEARGGSNMTQMQLSVLRSWVGDLASQNELLARAVEELEAEATASLAAERRRHSERSGGGKKRKICGNVTEMKIQNDTLQKENTAKEREIRRLLKDAQLYEQTISNLRNELSLGNHNPNVPKKDAEVMADTCCSQHCGNECGDWEPVRERSPPRDAHRDRIQKMEDTIKASSDSVKALRKMNVELSEELHGTRRVCAALGEQCRAAALRTQFKEDIIREMRRQLNQAKNKLKELSEPKEYPAELDYSRGTASAYDSVTIACARAAPRRQRDGSGDDALRVD